MYKIKQYLEDFYVTEALALPLLHNKTGKCFYYLMLKRNISTFDAISRISSELNIKQKEIGYAGLKDEDGVTSQYISLCSKHADTLYIPLIKGFYESDDGYIRLSYMGSGDESINIGVLNGNSFGIRVRNIHRDVYEYLKTRKKIDIYAINYYGQQRFGLPGQPSTTPTIGKYLLNHSYDEALALLATQNSELGRSAATHQGDAKSFFFSIDQRQHAFLLNSHASYQWNTELNSNIVKIAAVVGIYEMSENKYFFVPSIHSAIQILGKIPILPYSKFVYVDNQMLRNETYRNSIINITITINQVCMENNDYFCDLSFFLPSGSYATVVIDQFMNMVSNECELEKSPTLRMMSDECLSD